MRNRDNKVFYGVDRITVALYVLMVIMGFLNIYAAAYNKDHPFIFDLSQKYGKQLLWMAGAAIIGFAILLIDANFYTAFAYFFYGLMLAANILVLFLGKEIKGSHSWFKVGDLSIQPAEFMKFATALALAKYLSNRNIHVRHEFRWSLRDILKNYQSTFICLLILAVPFVLIAKLQDETGLAIVFSAFFIVLYREGLSLNLLLFVFMVAVLFILGLVVKNTLVLYITLVVIAALSFFFFKRNRTNITIAILLLIASFGVVRVSKLAYEKLPEHQKTRIDVLLRLREVDKKREGYNVNQAKIAIGSGGFFGKGYLQGTQTKYEFVPEQETDFIFCTVGEEWGFFGSTLVLLLLLALILRVIMLAERQRSDFSRIYGYGVAAVLFFHVAVNIGMTIGLIPVIGIPLEYFSYGGSSLWSFTILLFIFVKLDANRLLILR